MRRPFWYGSMRRTTRVSSPWRKGATWKGSLSASAGAWKRWIHTHACTHSRARTRKHTYSKHRYTQALANGHTHAPTFAGTWSSWKPDKWLLFVKQSSMRCSAAVGSTVGHSNVRMSHVRQSALLCKRVFMHACVSARRQRTQTFQLPQNTMQLINHHPPSRKRHSKTSLFWQLAPSDYYTVWFIRSTFWIHLDLGKNHWNHTVCLLKSEGFSLRKRC